jgi:protein-S-isoprenylcysteine O-methyltransferase Ste14
MSVSPGAFIYVIWGLWFFAWLADLVLGMHKRGFLRLVLTTLFHAVAAVALMLLLNLLNLFPATDLRYGLWPTGVPDALGWVLVSMVLAAFGFSLWASVHRITQMNRGIRVVDSGPYAVVRQPLHVGAILAAALTATLFGEPTTWLGAILFTTALITKVRLEERANDTPAYRAYCRRVPMFVPFWPTRD